MQLQSFADALNSDSLSNAAQTFRPLYQRSKEVLCCEWRDDVHGLFAAWTSCGAIVLVLCATLSCRCAAEL